jgi:hypothetical protein
MLDSQDSTLCEQPAQNPACMVHFQDPTTCCCSHISCFVQVLESLRALKELPYTAATQPATGPEASTAAAAGESSSGAATDSAAAAGAGEGSMQRLDSTASAGGTDASGPLGSLESPSATAAALAMAAAATGGN